MNSLLQAFFTASLLTVSPSLHHTEVFTVGLPSKEISSTLSAQAQIFDQNISPRVLDLLYPNQKALNPPVTLFFSPVHSVENFQGWEDASFWSEFKKNVIVIDPTLDQSSFSMVAIHELQHLLNEISKRRTNTREEKWLDEGLSELLEWRMSGLFPIKLTDEVLLSDHLGPLGDWSENRADFEKNYGQSFLFVYYLYQHFGGDEFLRKEILNPQTGWDGLTHLLVDLNPSITPENFSSENLFVHFSLAMATNSKKVAEHQIYSLSGSTFETALNNRQISAGFLSARNEKERVRPLSSSFYHFDLLNCTTIPEKEEVQIYQITRQSTGMVQIKKIQEGEEICPTTEIGSTSEIALIHLR